MIGRIGQMRGFDLAFEQQIIDFLRWLFPPWFITIFISMLPFIELRGALPVAYFLFDYPLAQAFLISVIGNMIPVPIILYCFRYVEKWLRKRWKWWDEAFRSLFKRTRRRSKGWVKKYGDVALLFFVGIPLPFTGAWTGSLISYLWGLRIKRSIFVIFVGVWMAGVIMSALCLFFAELVR
jgi:uncharacterized membrane protein